MGPRRIGIRAIGSRTNVAAILSGSRVLMKRSISLAAFVAEPFAIPQTITVMDGDGEMLEKAVAEAKAK